LSGGLIGYLEYADILQNSSASGVVTVFGSGSQTAIAGGLVGLSSNNATITNCHFTGSMTINSTNATVFGQGDYGGLVGLNYGSITQCYSTGAIVENGYNSALYSSAINNTHYSIAIGGLAGASSGTINSCYSAGNVTGSGYYETIGGLVGYLGPTYSFYDSYCTGNVAGVDNSSYIGGLIGYLVPAGSAPTPFRNMYTTGNLPGGYGGDPTLTHVGIIIGERNMGGPGYAYYPSTTVFPIQAYTTIFGYGGAPITISTATQANFAGFDFSHTWKWNPGQWPTLAWQ
jgi:hypothetical protein